MERHPPPWTLGEIAAWCGGRLEGPEDLRIDRPVLAGSRDPHGIAFAESAEFLERAVSGGVGAVLVTEGAGPLPIPGVRVDRPRERFLSLLELCIRPLSTSKGVHPSAVISAEANVAESASVGAYCVIEAGATVGPNARIYPFCYVGDGCRIGKDCILFPHAVLLQDVSLGDRTIVHSGVVLGADGFGFVWDGERRAKIPQVGGVSIGPDAEIGANSTIDRALAGQTLVGAGTKIDNLVQIAHNVSIGEHGVLAGQSGVAGSASIGDRFQAGGQVGIRDQVRIVDDVSLGARSVVLSDIEEPGDYFGDPVLPAKEGLRLRAILLKLPELLARIRRIESAQKRDGE